MKKIKEFKDIKKVYVGDGLIVQRKNSIDSINDDLSVRIIIEGNIFNSRYINNVLLYQLNDAKNTNVIAEGKVKSLTGYVELITAIPLNDNRFYTYYEVRDKELDFFILDTKLNILGPGAPDCNRGDNDFLFKIFHVNAYCFDSRSQQQLWHRTFPTVIEQDSIIPRDGHLYFILKSSWEFVALDAKTGELLWEKDSVGRITLFRNKFYCFAGDRIDVRRTDTGEIEKSNDISKALRDHDFFATGYHYVYDEYIFCSTSGGKGKLAVFDTASLQFVQMLEMGEMIPLNRANVLWHNKRLFVLDFKETLHVFE